MAMEVKLRHPEKQDSPKEVTDVGIVMEVKPLQSEKFPNEVTDDGMAMEIKLRHPEKQDSPKEVTDVGIVMEVKPLQSEKQ